MVCIQDTLSSRAALGLPSASREQRYLAYKVMVWVMVVVRVIVRVRIEC